MLLIKNEKGCVLNCFSLCNVWNLIKLKIFIQYLMFIKLRIISNYTEIDVYIFEYWIMSIVDTIIGICRK